ncbi:MAG: site-2 protease family protein [Deltaproteobacteria bacterium]|nr:site-2 protease family protein [Deltaproteobacteria bacterium]MBW2393235.1 site-2 protease family protein [Deltaproteobacteria bacterium]
MTPDVLALGLIWYFVLLLSLTVHEAAHGWVALRLGDETAYLAGQVALDPLPHIRREPFGMVLVPILFFGLSVARGGAPWMIGWASTPYDSNWAFAHPRRAGWMALAGPASNLFLALLAAAIIRVGVSQGVFVPGLLTFESVAMATVPGVWETFATLLSLVFSLNLLLFVFNLLPVPPLDGSGMLNLFVREDQAQRIMEWMAQPGWAFGGLLVAWLLIRRIFYPIFIQACQMLYVGV